MRGVVATRYGGPEVLALVDRPAPACGPADVLIDVRAASLNPRRARGKIVVRIDR